MVRIDGRARADDARRRRCRLLPTAPARAPAHDSSRHAAGRSRAVVLAGSRPAGGGRLPARSRRSRRAASRRARSRRGRGTRDLHNGHGSSRSKCCPREAGVGGEGVLPHLSPVGRALTKFKCCRRPRRRARRSRARGQSGARWRPPSSRWTCCVAKGSRPPPISEPVYRPAVGRGRPTTATCARVGSESRGRPGDVSPAAA